MGAEHIDDALIVLALAVAQLVPTGANSAGGRRRAEQGDLLRILMGEIEELLAQHSLNAVMPGIDGAKGIRQGATHVHDPA